VQHGRTYANIDKGDDVLELGANRAIDLIVAKESGGGRGGRPATPGRALGEHPSGGALEVKAGRYGPYVAWGKIFATLPKAMAPESVTLEQAIALVDAKAEAKGGAKGKAKAGAAKAKAPAKKAPAKKPAAKKAAATETVEKKPPKAARG
jgi:DNA topoisomerase-1